MSQEWFYTKDGKSKIGPVSAAALQALAKCGELLPRHMVLKAGTTQWVAASKIKGLFPAAETPPKASSPSPGKKPAVASQCDGSAGRAKPSVPTNRRGSRIFVVAGGLVLGFVLLGSCALVGVLFIWPVVGGGGSETLGAIGSKSNATEILAFEIDEAYRWNAIAADEKYKGKRIETTGIVTLVGPKENGRAAYVAVSSGFVCLFDDRQNSALAKLVPGQVVAVQGTFLGNPPGRLDKRELENCELLDPKATRLELDATELDRAWSDDQLTKVRYQGKTLSITGCVAPFKDQWTNKVGAYGDLKTIGNQDSGCVIVLSRRSRRGKDLYCYFDKMQRQDVKKLSIGQLVTIRGSCEEFESHFSLRLVMKKCELIVAYPYEAAVKKNLQSICIGLHSFHDAHKCLPDSGVRSPKDPGGNPVLSWRVAILPYIGEAPLYQQFDLTLPWDHPTNKKLIPRMPKLYLRPGAVTKEQGMTHYRVLVGTQTVFPPTPSKITLLGITDGTAHTIMVAEATEPTVWTQPDDLLYDPKRPLPKLGVAPSGFYAVFGDAVVSFLPAGTPDQRIRAYITRNGGEIVPPPN